MFMDVHCMALEIADRVLQDPRWRARTPIPRMVTQRSMTVQAFELLRDVEGARDHGIAVGAPLQARARRRSPARASPD